MRIRTVMVLLLAAGCKAPASDDKDSGAAATQKAVDSISARAESGAHDSTAGTPKAVRPIIERAQRDSVGRALPRAEVPVTATKRDTLRPPAGPRMADPTRPDERNP